MDTVLFVCALIFAKHFEINSTCRERLRRVAHNLHHQSQRRQLDDDTKLWLSVIIIKK